MRVVSTFFHPSSVLHSVKCKLDDTDTEYLVVSKPSRLEVFALLPEGTKPRCTLEVWGIVSSLKVVPHQDRPDTLLITTETPDPLAMLLEYLPECENGEASLREYNHLSLRSSFSRTMDYFDGAVMHPSGDIAVVATYVGKLRALVLKGSRKRVIKFEFDCIMTELNVLSMCFLPIPSRSSQVYELAILHRDYTGTLQLTSHELSVQQRELSIEVSHALPQIVISDDNARALLSIPAKNDAPGGVLVLGGQTILYFAVPRSPSTDKGKGKENAVRKTSRKNTSFADATTSSAEPYCQTDWPLSDLTACALLDADGSRILLGDRFGQLSILMLTRTNSEVSLMLVRLGETSPATTITHLNGGVIFVGSHFGDSQVVRITPSLDPLIGVQLDILDTYKNLAPIMDFLTVDTQDSGQIVTCSGAHNAGSLRVIRNGVDLEELATADNIVHAKFMWRLRFSYEASTDNILVVSTLQSTHFYNLANSELGTLDELEEGNYAGFSHEATLAICNMACVILPTEDSSGSPRYEDSQHVVQVTRTGVFLVNLFSGMRDSTWCGNSEIVAASVNASQIAVALETRKVVILMVKDGQLVELRSRVFDGGNISAITIDPYDATQPFSHYIAVGFYESNLVSVISVSDLKRSLFSPIVLPHLPISLLLTQFGIHDANRRPPGGGHYKTYPTHLLVGLGDGNLRTYSLDPGNGNASVGEEKLISLGSTKPVFIMPFQDGGRMGQNILICGSRPVVLYWENGRLKHSPLVRKGISAACPLNSKDFPWSIVFAAVIERAGKVESTNLLIGRIRELQKLHIRTIPFGLDNPVRISHLPEHKVFGVGCQRTQPFRVGENPLESGCFKILDDTTFEQLHHFPCEPDEEVTVVQTLSLLLDNTGIQMTYFVVGTQYQTGEFEAREGRLLLFEKREAWLPELKDIRKDARNARGTIGLVTSIKVNGCVFAVSEIGGRLAAAINESVYVFRLKKTENASALPATHNSIELEELTKWTHNYIVSNMVSRGDRVYIGDTISSLSVVEWHETSQRLLNVARDYAPLWPVSIQTLNVNDIIGCNNDCNLFVFNVNVTEKRLEQGGNYYLSDCVNKFIPGSLLSRSGQNQSLKPEQLFVTSTGRIGVVSEIDKEHALHMTALQRNLANIIPGPGNVKHAKWRAPKNSRGGSDSIGEASGFLDGDFLERFLDFERGSLEAQKVMEGGNEAEKLGISFSEVVRILEQLQSVH